MNLRKGTYLNTVNRNRRGPGIFWQRNSVSGPACSWRALAYSPQLQLFTIIGNDATPNLRGCTYNGNSFNRISTLPSAPNRAWFDICWSPKLGIFAAVATNAGEVDNVMTSPDTINWTMQTHPANGWRSIDWSPQLELFAAVATDTVSPQVMTSPDGIAWTSRNAPSVGGWNNIKWCAELGMFVAVGNSGTNRVMYSSDGINWSLASVTARTYFGLAFSSKRNIVVACSTTGVPRNVYSPDGINYSDGNLDTSVGWDSAAYSPELDMFVACTFSAPGFYSYGRSGNDFVPAIQLPIRVEDVKWGMSRFVTCHLDGFLVGTFN